MRDLVSYWTIVRLPLSGRHYDPQEVVTDGLLHASREAALASLLSDLQDDFDHMEFQSSVGDGPGSFQISEGDDPATRVDGPDSTFISYPNFECAYLVARLSSAA